MVHGVDYEFKDFVRAPLFGPSLADHNSTPMHGPTLFYPPSSERRGGTSVTIEGSQRAPSIMKQPFFTLPKASLLSLFFVV